MDADVLLALVIFKLLFVVIFFQVAATAVELDTDEAPAPTKLKAVANAFHCGSVLARLFGLVTPPSRTCLISAVED